MNFKVCLVHLPWDWLKSLRASTLLVLKNLTFNNSKNYFIYFNNTFYNTPNINGSIFFSNLFKYSFFFSFFYLSLFLSLWSVNNYCELPHPQPPPTKTNKPLPITSLWTTTTALPPSPCEQTINPYPLPPTPTLCKDSFSYFLVFGSIRKNESKGKLYLLNIKKYSLFLEIIFRYFFFLLGKQFYLTAS